jgi:hypothetical protein
MAGGMGRNEWRRSLSDRAGASDHAGAAQPTGSGRGPSGQVKPCWVTDRHGRLPGLLLEWRRVAAGFQGRVVRPVVEPDGEVLVVEEWLPAELLEPGWG